ncbi:MAG: glycosyltransferase family 4 protein [Ignavibacteriaceae bacterium]
MSKNVLMIAYTNYSTDARVVKEAEAAVKNGYGVDFIALRRNGDKAAENINGVNVIRVNQYRYRGAQKLKYITTYLEFYFRVLFKSSLLHLKKKYKIVHVNNMPDFIVLSTLFLKLTGAKIILDIHDPMPNLYISKMEKGKKFFHKMLVWQELISAKFANRVITTTDPMADALAKDGIPRNKITVVANFPDENLFSVNNEYSINGQLKLIYHGTIAERWGLQKIVLALSRVKNKEKFFFRIIGEGDYSDELKKLIKDNNLQTTVCFDNKSYPFAEIGEHIKDYNLGIASLDLNAHTDYALSTKMVEYFATGIPVLTIKSRVVNHYFGESGCFFYDSSNIDSIIDIFNRLSENTSVLLNKRNEVMHLRERFIWLNEKKKYLKLLNELGDN